MGTKTRVLSKVLALPYSSICFTMPMFIPSDSVNYTFLYLCTCSLIVMASALIRGRFLRDLSCLTLLGAISSHVFLLSVTLNGGSERIATHDAWLPMGVLGLLIGAVIVRQSKLNRLFLLCMVCVSVSMSIALGLFAYSIQSVT